MRAVALLLALLVGAQCAAAQYKGFIRTSNLKFVDDNCKEFVPLGMNTYVTLSPAPPRLHCPISLLCCTESRLADALIRCSLHPISSWHSALVCPTVTVRHVANHGCADAAIPFHICFKHLHMLLQMAAVGVNRWYFQSGCEPSHQPIWPRPSGVHHASGCQQQSDHSACVCSWRQLNLGFAANARYAVNYAVHAFEPIKVTSCILLWKVCRELMTNASPALQY